MPDYNRHISLLKNTHGAMFWSLGKNSPTMKYAVTSDVHLGHIKTPTSHIIASFIKHILTELNKDLDVLFIPGDLCDRLLDLNSKEAQQIIGFFNYLLSYCYENNILLRVMEGTPSHDWQQSQTLVKLNEIRTEKCDLKYHKVLDIEYIERINKYVLYVPDEWTNSHDDLEAQIKEKLNEHGITQVDIAMLHGQFAYQFAGRPYHGFHYKEEYFLRLVKGFIHVGHYHVYNPLDRILPNGSLERLAQGEEDPKGYIIVNDNRYTFIENTSAWIYKTITITAATTVERLDRQIEKYPVGSYIRLLMSRDHPFNITFNELKLRYLDYNLKKINKENVAEKLTATYILSDADLEFDNKFILEANIHKTLVDLVAGKYSLNSAENSKFMNYISIFKEVENHAPALSE